MLKSIVFRGKKQFTAEYYATEIKNRSYKSNQDNGYYKGYGNELNSIIIGDTTFRIDSGLFLVQGRQCSVVLGTTEDIEIPVQNETIKGYIIAKISTYSTSGENIELIYKLGTSTEFPSLIQQDTYNIDDITNAIYELPLYSFDVYKTITNVKKLIKPVSNSQVEVGESPTEYLSVGGILFKKISVSSNSYRIAQLQENNTLKTIHPETHTDAILTDEDGVNLTQKLNTKADKNTTYTKEETNSLLNAKANKSDVYTKTETDNKLNTKANASNVYTKSQIYTKEETNALIDKIVAGEVELTNYYTKTETETLIAEKLDEKQITEVNCTHEVEITGFGEEDCNLVIDDQDVVITKIQGQTRRKSLNLINVTTTNTESSYFVYDKELKLSAGTYTIVIYAKDNLTCEILADNVSLGYLYTNNSKTFTLSNGCSHFKIYVNGLTTNVKVMLNEGSTALPYEPYDNTLVNSKCDFVSTGRNLFDISTLELGAIDTNYGIDIASNERKRSKYIRVLPNKNYYLDYSGTTVNIIQYDKNKNYIKTGVGGIFTTSINTYYIRFYGSLNPSYVMLNYGDTALPYEPYVEDTMQCGIELGQWDYHDNINHITHRQTSEMITLNGSENWKTWSTKDSTKPRFAINISEIGANAVFSNTEITIASTFINRNAVETWDCLTGICMGDTNNNVGIYIEGITTVDELKAWLQANPITFVYKLATETTETNVLPSGYKVWYKGMQVQKTDTIPYILTKQYAISLAMQVLNNVSVDRSQQKQIDELKENKLNKSDLGHWNFDNRDLKFNNDTILSLSGDGTHLNTYNYNLYLEGASQRPFYYDGNSEEEIALIKDLDATKESLKNDLKNGTIVAGKARMLTGLYDVEVPSEPSSNLDIYTGVGLYLFRFLYNGFAYSIIMDIPDFNYGYSSPMYHSYEIGKNNNIMLKSDTQKRVNAVSLDVSLGSDSSINVTWLSCKKIASY